MIWLCSIWINAYCTNQIFHPVAVHNYTWYSILPPSTCRSIASSPYVSQVFHRFHLGNICIPIPDERQVFSRLHTESHKSHLRYPIHSACPEQFDPMAKEPKLVTCVFSWERYLTRRYGESIRVHDRRGLHSILWRGNVAKQGNAKAARSLFFP
jgi:hypothetical protein